MSERKQSKKAGCSSFLALLTCSSTKASARREIEFSQEQQLSDTLTGNNQIQPVGSSNRGGQVRLSGRPLV